MALVVGDFVYLDVRAGLLPDPPLFGVVDVDAGTPPDTIRVNWDNGTQQYYNTGQGLQQVAYSDALDVAWLTKWVNFGISTGGRGSGFVLSAWTEDPDDDPEDKVLVFTPEGKYIILPASAVVVDPNR